MTHLHDSLCDDWGAMEAGLVLARLGGRVNVTGIGVDEERHADGPVL